jgi:hypothetical protein
MKVCIYAAYRNALPVWFYQFLHTISYKAQTSGGGAGEITKHKMFSDSQQTASKLLILKIFQRDFTINVHTPSRKVPVILV